MCAYPTTVLGDTDCIVLAGQCRTIHREVLGVAVGLHYRDRREKSIQHICTEINKDVRLHTSGSSDSLAKFLS